MKITIVEFESKNLYSKEAVKNNYELLIAVK